MAERVWYTRCAQVALCLASVVWATVPVERGLAQTPEVLHNADIMTLVKAGLGEEVIVVKIRASTCQFDTSEGALSVLKAAGVPSAVLRAMTDATKSPVRPDNESHSQLPGAADPGTSFQLFHFVTGGTWHFGVLTVSKNRLTWNETTPLADSVAQKTGLLDPRSIKGGVEDDNFDVPCADVLDVGKNKMIIGYHVRLTNRTFNVARAVQNKDGKLAPKDHDKIPGLEEAIARACSRQR